MLAGEYDGEYDRDMIGDDDETGLPAAEADEERASCGRGGVEKLRSGFDAGRVGGNATAAVADAAALVAAAAADDGIDDDARNGGRVECTTVEEAEEELDKEGWDEEGWDEEE